MRKATPRDFVVQCLVGAVLLLPLCLGFLGEGSFLEVFGKSAEDGSSQLSVLFSALGRSSWIGMGATVIALALGIPGAWVLAKRKRAPLLLALCGLPLALAPSAVISGWLFWAAPPQVASAFQTTAPQMPGLGPLFSSFGVSLLLGFSLWPIVAFEAWPAFARARTTAYEAALLTGTPARAFFRIVLPMSGGELAAGALLVFLLAASDFTVSSLLLVRTLPIEVYDFLSINKSASAAWAAMPLVLLGVAGALLLTRIQRHKFTEAIDQAAPSSSLTSQTDPASGWGWCDGLFGLALVAGFLVPIAGCGIGAFTGEQKAGQAFAVGLPYLFHAFRLAAAAGILAVIAGSVRIILWPDSRATPLRASALLLLIVPGAFLAAGLLTADVQARVGLDLMGPLGQSFNRMFPAELTLVFGFAFRFIYLPLRLTEEGLRGLDPAILESAELAGHSRLHRGLGVALPMLWRHLLCAGALVFILGLGDLPVSAKLAPPGAMPASVWLFERQHQGYTEEVFAASLLLGIAAMLALVFAGGITQWFMGRRRRSIFL